MMFPISVIYYAKLVFLVSRCVFRKAISQSSNSSLLLVLLASARSQLRKMATSGEHKAFCVLDFHTNKSVVSVQRHFRFKFGRDAPSGKSIRKWYPQFQDRGCICNRKSTGRPSIGEEAVERVRATFARSLGGTWVPAWCVPCYAWSAHWKFVIFLKETWWVFLFFTTYCVYLRYIKLEWKIIEIGNIILTYGVLLIV
jgi:hypothetical protein